MANHALKDKSILFIYFASLSTCKDFIATLKEAYEVCNKDQVILTTRKFSKVKFQGSRSVGKGGGVEVILVSEVVCHNCM